MKQARMSAMEGAAEKNRNPIPSEQHLPACLQVDLLSSQSARTHVGDQRVRQYCRQDIPELITALSSAPTELTHASCVVPARTSEHFPSEAGIVLKPVFLHTGLYS